jgi:hypothetical protein
MSATKTTGERIETLQEKIGQLENQKKQLVQKQKEDERRARTKRLIERGAILESLISGADKFNNEQIKAFLEKTVTTDNARKILDGLTAQRDKTAAAEKATGTEQGGG